MAQFVELAAEPPLLAELPVAALLEELELLHPAASKIDPIAAADATIAFDARKVKPSPCRPPGDIGGHALASWLDKSHLGQAG